MFNCIGNLYMRSILTMSSICVNSYRCSETERARDSFIKLIFFSDVTLDETSYTMNFGMSAPLVKISKKNPEF